MSTTDTWIGNELARIFPHEDLTRGIDLNRNGVLEEREKIRDCNGNGSVGDQEDWFCFYQNNPLPYAAFRADQSFFANFSKWGRSFRQSGRSLKPDNPFHELMAIEAEGAAPEALDKAYRMVAKILSEVRKRDSSSLSPQRKLRLVYDVMESFEIGIKFSTQENDSFAENINRHELDCDTSSAVVLAVAHEMDWPVSMVSVPGHMFVRWEDGQIRFNGDINHIIFDEYPSDRDYQEKYKIPSVAIQEGVYLKSLSSRERISFWMKCRAIGKFNNRRYPESLVELKRARALHPQNVSVIRLMGECYSRLGQFEKAIRSFREALALCPDDFETMNGLAHVYARQENPQRALYWFQKALLAISSGDSTDLLKDRIATMKKNIAILQEAIPVKKENRIIRQMNVAGAYFEKGQYHRAIQEYEKLRDAARDPSLPSGKLLLHDIERNLGGAYFNQGQYRQAAKWFRRALSRLDAAGPRQDLLAETQGLLVMAENLFESSDFKVVDSLFGGAGDRF